ncbi:hypothetical protein ACFO3K_16930 [Cellulomonas algicola]|uniref:hypothetical protein n=1 Tax=Cellulomonas algicola TaxID=2071633 RepID=UPI001C3F53B7|nr:hypothetical protein [Cellulomonas algicola]
MVRIVNQSLTATHAPISDADARRAARRLARTAARNPLRRVRVDCEPHAVRDPLATLGDRVWCDAHADWATVVEVTE